MGFCKLVIRTWGDGQCRQYLRPELGASYEYGDRFCVFKKIYLEGVLIFISRAADEINEAMRHWIVQAVEDNCLRCPYNFFLQSNNRNRVIMLKFSKSRHKTAPNQ